MAMFRQSNRELAAHLTAAAEKCFATGCWWGWSDITSPEAYEYCKLLIDFNLENPADDDTYGDHSSWFLLLAAEDLKG